MLRLMIVDDEQIIREALCRMIDYEAIGYQLIGTAKNGMEAYDIICDEYPDVVITDIRMPILGGLDLIDRSIKADSRITFILLSGYSEFEYAKQAMQYGVRHYLLKPTNKQELLETLIRIREEKQQLEEQEQERSRQLLGELQEPLEQCFLTECLEYPDAFSGIFDKYLPLLSIPAAGTAACICSYMEESCLDAFVTDLRHFFRNRSLLCFPVLYVKNNAIIIFQAITLEAQKQFQAFLENLCYPGQAVSFVTHFLHADTTGELFHTVLAKISRFQQILLLGTSGTRHEIRNNIASPRRVSQLGERIARAADEQQLAGILGTVFTEEISLDAARNLALGIFLESNPQPEATLLDLTCDFFRKLYSSPSIEEISRLTRIVLLQNRQKARTSAAGANIALLKTYVSEHLDSENLSLNWLARHYLFVSVGYLSKQFVKEEGVRFSDYLNKKRMEEAERLMILYRNDNIKNIARQVGFGSNPQYFSQVFKRYTGQTPTEYIDRLMQQ